MKQPFIEQDCTIEHEGQKFTSGGAVITDDYIIGYMSEDMKVIKTWHGETITETVNVFSSWRIFSWMSNRMYQIHALYAGKWYTGRTLGGGMIVRLKVCKQ
jgi:hypothetical protein